MTSRARFYFSFRSPYSWIAARAIEERGIADRFEYVPYWSPDPITAARLAERGGEMFYVDMSKPKHLYILQDIKRLVTRLGYPMKWPVDIDPWWELPHLAYLHARRLGRGHDLFWAAHRARWERGEDICTPEVIRRLAAELDLDPAALVGAPEDPEVRALGVDALYQAYEDNVFGVPFFVKGFSKFWGVDRMDELSSSLGRPSVLHEAPPLLTDRPGCYDTDSAGGCG